MLFQHANASRLLILLAVVCFGSRTTQAADSPNVLLIAIDDMNDWVGCLGGHPNAKSPHIDRLAKRGMLFTNAHCQAPICNPSRTSIMYGLRPSTTGVYMNSPKPWTVRALDSRVTLARHFAANGYKTFTTGKIYHGSGLPPGDFDVVGPRPGQRLAIDQRLIPPTPNGANGLWDFGPQSYDEADFQDHVDATWAIDVIDNQIQANEKPFFLAVGFYRPHVPFYSPTRVFNQIPPDQIQLPQVKVDDRADIPEIAAELTKAPAAPPHRWFVESDQWQTAVASYLACIRWTDEQVGRLITAVDESPHADNTIVVLYSDHGFFLGEKQRWAKQSLWERATHVPLVIDSPGGNHHGTCDHPVELLSIYPTLIELCGIPPRDDLDGHSLMPLLENPQTSWPHLALTTHGKGNHSTRNQRYRLIRYHDGSEELYDLQDDQNEWTNLASDPKFAQVKSTLAKGFPHKNAEPAKATSGDKPSGQKRRPNRTGSKRIDTGRKQGPRSVEAKITNAGAGKFNN
ncbi:MAG: sulfatase [Pirellulaceae bacterium]|nr:sulfatase [Pirellulaceae bacterium]